MIYDGYLTELWHLPHRKVITKSLKVVVTFRELITLGLALEIGQMWSGTWRTPLNEFKMTIAPERI